jgi:RNA polymerase sigma factor (sigma-70 family)
MTMSGVDRSDEQLLAGAREDAAGFGTFYARHERVVLGFFMRATGRSELALDLAAETFARAFESRAGFDPRRGTARVWLFGIARHVLSGSVARGRVEAGARARLGMAALTHDARLAASIEETVDAVEQATVDSWLASLTADQHMAVRGHVIEERTYAELASELGCSQAVVRQRVHRGLAVIREKARQAP